jgi:threonine dehydratase
MLSTQSILDAEARIREQVRETPLEFSFPLSRASGSKVYLKLEHLQRTGSFKLRGAMNKILLLDPVELRQGVIAASTGNHGLGVACAAQMAGARATIYLPRDASESKIALITHFGAKAVPDFKDCLEAELRARADAERQGMTFISPYNDRDVIAGQGVIGVELHRALDPIDAVFIAVGGGGLIAGVAAYLKSVNPSIRVVGCWPEHSPVMIECLKAGEIHDVAEQATISESTAGGLEPGSITFSLCRELIDDFALVSEPEIYAAMREIFVHERWIVEGSAGVAVAAFLKHREKHRDQNVVLLLCGRNIPAARWSEVMNFDGNGITQQTR